MNDPSPGQPRLYARLFWSSDSLALAVVYEINALFVRYPPLLFNGFVTTL